MVIKMAKFNLFDQEISIPNSYIRYRNMMYHKNIVCGRAIKEFEHWYDHCFGIEAVLDKVDHEVYELISKYAVDELYGSLDALEIYDISREDYIRKCVDLSGFFNGVEHIENQIMSISHDKDMMKEYRAARKASRGKFVGGGFGISGAIKGSVKAGALNATTGMAHSLVNTVGDAGSSIAAAARKAGVYNSDTKNLLSKGIQDAFLKTFSNHVRLVNTYYSEYYVNGFDARKANALYDNAKKHPDKREDLLAQAVVQYPSQKILDYIFDNYPEERMHICKIGNCLFEIDSYWPRFEKVFQDQYETVKQNGAKEVDDFKQSVMYTMQECGVEESEVYNQINYDELVRIAEEYMLYSEDDVKENVLNKFMEYDAPDIQKKQVIKEKGIWEIADKYNVKYSQEDVEDILSRYYPDEAKQNEEKAQKAKTQIKVVMKALNVKSSQIFDQLEEDCIARLCPNIAEALEDDCRKMVERIVAYDALSKNKKPFVDKIKHRIETIWSEEDAVVFDELYLRTNLHNQYEINQAIDFVKQKGRTENSQKYINALEACNEKNIKTAQKYQKKTTEMFKFSGVGLTVFGFVLTLMSPVCCLIFFLGILLWNVHSGREKYWYMLTINETDLHRDLLLPDKTK